MFMVDPGSDTTFVRNTSLPDPLGLVGDPCLVPPEGCGSERHEGSRRPAMRCRWRMRRRRQVHRVSALGLDTITDLAPGPRPRRQYETSDARSCLNLSSNDLKEMWTFCWACATPRSMGAPYKQWGNLRLMKAPIGGGWSLRGTHPDLQHASPQLPPSLSAAAYVIRQADEDQGESLAAVPHSGGEGIP